MKSLPTLYLLKTAGVILQLTVTLKRQILT